MYKLRHLLRTRLTCTSQIACSPSVGLIALEIKCQRPINERRDRLVKIQIEPSYVRLHAEYNIAFFLFFPTRIRFEKRQKAIKLFSVRCSFFFFCTIFIYLYGGKCKLFRFAPETITIRCWFLHALNESVTPVFYVSFLFSSQRLYYMQFRERYNWRDVFKVFLQNRTGFLSDGDGAILFVDFWFCRNERILLYFVWIGTRVAKIIQHEFDSPGEVEIENFCQTSDLSLCCYFFFCLCNLIKKIWVE